MCELLISGWEETLAAVAELDSGAPDDWVSSWDPAALKPGDKCKVVYPEDAMYYDSVQAYDAVVVGDHPCFEECRYGEMLISLVNGPTDIFPMSWIRPANFGEV